MHKILEQHIDELYIGESAFIEKKFTDDDIEKYAAVSWDNNLIHMDEAIAAKSIFGRRIVQGMLVSGLISGTIGTKLPGNGTIYLQQNLAFKAPVFFGDTVRATVTVTEILLEKNICKLSTICTNQHGMMVIEGNAVVMPGKR